MVLLCAALFLSLAYGCRVVRYIDGFDTYPANVALTAASAGILGRWDLVGINTTNSTTRFASASGNSLTASSRNNQLGKHFGSNEASGTIGFAYNPGTSGGTAYRTNLLVLFDGGVLATAGNVQLVLFLNADLTISVCRNVHATVLGTSTLALTAGQWHYIEFRWNIADSIASGDVEVVVSGPGGDNVSFLSLAALLDTKHTANAFATGFTLSGNVPSITTPGGTTYLYDDLYWADWTGGVNDGFLGNRRVVTLRPDANGNSSDMVGSDGNSVDNYLLVDDPVSHDSDSTFVGSATVGDHDSYGLSDLPGTTNDVAAVQVVMNAKKTDVGARSINSVVRTGGADFDGSAKVLTDTYTAHLQVYDENPDTAAQWTPSEVNGMEAGVKVNA